MRIDTKPVESPNISWAQARRERLLLLRLVLVSALELAALALIVLVLIALVALVTGDADLAARAMPVCAALAAVIVGVELWFRAVKRKVESLDEIMDGEVEQLA